MKCFKGMRKGTACFPRNSGDNLYIVSCMRSLHVIVEFQNRSFTRKFCFTLF